MINLVVELIAQSLNSYLEDYNALNDQAKNKFSQRDWPGIQDISARRIGLYKQKIGTLALKLKRTLQADNTLTFWTHLKAAFSENISSRPDREIAETYFNSACRKTLQIQTVNNECMFVESGPHEQAIDEDLFIRFLLDSDLRECANRIIASFAFDAAFEDLNRDINFLALSIYKDLINERTESAVYKVDLLTSIFYRNKAAYLIGRIHIDFQSFRPFFIAIRHTEKGLYIDTLISDPKDAGVIFSFSHSYFFVSANRPGAMVGFLKSVLPGKAVSELYSSIGFHKHAKTELYREYLAHLQTSDSPFVFTPGIKGMVMTVFTLDDYPIVFKVIKDKIEPPKTVTRAEVRQKYRLVKMHDRVGRLADTHEFEHFIFDRVRFAPEVLDELRQLSPSILREEGDKVIISHLYTERKMTPLNIYLEDPNNEGWEDVVLDFGNAIKQLAAANIFPGDMFLKNFGLTKHKRVIFYDYDELGLLTAYHFRQLPKAENLSDAYSNEPWFAVGDNDVFPEQFIHFLAVTPEMKACFARFHSDIYSVDFWVSIQNRILNHEVIDTFPYDKSKRFRNI